MPSDDRPGSKTKLQNRIERATSNLREASAGRNRDSNRTQYHLLARVASLNSCPKRGKKLALKWGSPVIRHRLALTMPFQHAVTTCSSFTTDGLHPDPRRIATPWRWHPTMPDSAILSKTNSWPVVPSIAEQFETDRGRAWLQSQRQNNQDLSHHRKRQKSARA